MKIQKMRDMVPFLISCHKLQVETYDDVLHFAAALRTVQLHASTKGIIDMCMRASVCACIAKAF